VRSSRIKIRGGSPSTRSGSIFSTRNGRGGEGGSGTQDRCAEREEQQEIEASSRLHQEDGVHFMTATVLYQTETAEPATTPITFILAGNRLITLRYAEPRAFSIFIARCRKPDPSPTTGTAVLIGLIETIVDRMADFIKRIQAEVDSLIG